MEGRRDYVRGSANHSAKLTEDEVKQLKSDLKAGKSKRSVASAYGVSVHTVKDIYGGRTWRNVKI